MSSTVNPLASYIRKTHIYLDKLFPLVSNIKPHHKAEAALQAHVLSMKAQKLANDLKAFEHLTQSDYTTPKKHNARAKYAQRAKKRKHVKK